MVEKIRSEKEDSGVVDIFGQDSGLLDISGHLKLNPDSFEESFDERALFSSTQLSVMVEESVSDVADEFSSLPSFPMSENVKASIKVQNASTCSSRASNLDPSPDPSLALNLDPRHKPSVAPNLDHRPDSSFAPNLVSRSDSSFALNLVPRPDPSLAPNLDPRPDPSLALNLDPRPDPSFALNLDQASNMGTSSRSSSNTGSSPPWFFDNQENIENVAPLQASFEDGDEEEEEEEGEEEDPVVEHVEDEDRQSELGEDGLAGNPEAMSDTNSEGNWLTYAELMLDSYPPKSKVIYLKAYKAFERYLKSQKQFVPDSAPTEIQLLNYFHFLKFEKKLAPTTLWSTYSRINACVKRVHGFSLKNFARVTEVLKSFESGYKVKKASIFSPQEVQLSIKVTNLSYIMFDFSVRLLCLSWFFHFCLFEWL